MQGKVIFAIASIAYAALLGLAFYGYHVSFAKQASWTLKSGKVINYGPSLSGHKGRQAQLVVEFEEGQKIIHSITKKYYRPEEFPIGVRLEIYANPSDLSDFVLRENTALFAFLIILLFPFAAIAVYFLYRYRIARLS